MKLETVRIGDVSPDPANVRKHSGKNIDAIKASLRRFGQQKPIVVDAKGIVLAGNGTLTAARELGWSEIQIVRTDLEGVQATAFGIADNRSAELAEWDDKLAEVLASLEAEDFPLEDIGFDPKDLADLMPETQESDADAEPQVDKAEELRVKWDVELGQVWQLGEHRIACGRCTDPEIAKVLCDEKDLIVVTDPPYCSGGSQEAQKKQGTWGKIDSDNLSTRGYTNLMQSVLSLYDARAFYIFTDWRMWIPLHDLVEASGNPIRSMIVWAKDTPALGGIWRTQHELCMFASKQGQQRKEGVATIGNVLRAKRTGNIHHPTQKPVEIIAEIIANDARCEGRENSVVVEPFSGSGTTLMACEQLKRKCRAAEVYPGYVAVAIQRWADATGKEPRKL